MVPASDTQRIQEVHAVLLHLLCELIEDSLVGSTSVGAEERLRLVGSREASVVRLDADAGGG